MSFLNLQIKNVEKIGERNDRELAPKVIQFEMQAPNQLEFIILDKLSGDF